VGVTRGRGGVATAVVALTFCLVAAATGVGAALDSPYAMKAVAVAARPIAGPAPVWHRGTPPPPLEPVLAAAAQDRPVPTASGLAAALAPLIDAGGLGGHTALSVVDAITGESLYALGPDAATTPASTTKLVTAATVLAARGPGHRLATRVVAGAQPGEVVLIGAGDPTLTAGAAGTYPGAARLDQLAAAVKQTLGGTPVSKVVYDGSAFAGPVTGPGWDADVASGGYAAPITALMLDGGRANPRQARAPATRVAQPDLAAAQALAGALGLAPTAVAAGTAPDGARQLGVVESPPMIRLVDLMLTESDNVIAEALARQVALARSQPGTFDGAAAAMKDVLAQLGVPVTGYGLRDGSGLSRLNRLSPALLTAVLAVAARPDHPELHSIFGGLPVAAYSGTLRDRYRSAAAGGTAAGYVRAKTGTLTGVSALSGIAVDADGRVLAFAILADAVNRPTATAQETLDRMAAGLAACGCR
jgi:D-alanyl-D-alanine carboxypeptidase/D-alanyl-D-alanine-endopeptidase (penicillin-binding protein 4)